MAKEKLFSDALRVAVLMEERGTGKTRIRLIAEMLAQEAMNGNIAAIKEIGDRLDGKPTQAIIGGDEEDAPIRLIRTIELVALTGPDKGED